MARSFFVRIVESLQILRPEPGILWRSHLAERQRSVGVPCILRSRQRPCWARSTASAVLSQELKHCRSCTYEICLTVNIPPFAPLGFSIHSGYELDAERGLGYKTNAKSDHTRAKHAFG
jgi:hypothetical protein